MKVNHNIILGNLILIVIFILIISCIQRRGKGFIYLLKDEVAYDHILHINDSNLSCFHYSISEDFIVLPITQFSNQFVIIDTTCFTVRYGMSDSISLTNNHTCNLKLIIEYYTYGNLEQTENLNLRSIQRIPKKGDSISIASPGLMGRVGVGSLQNVSEVNLSEFMLDNARWRNRIKYLNLHADTLYLKSFSKFQVNPDDERYQNLNKLIHDFYSDHCL